MFERLYSNRAGRLLAALLARPCLSKLAGAFLDTRASKPLIKPFIKAYDIDMSGADESARYNSFNSFFTRKLKAGSRPLVMDANALISPCDGWLTVERIEPNGVFIVKGTPYTLEGLLDDRPLAEEFAGGTCLILFS